MVGKAIAAGGSTYKEPQDYGFMYEHNFQDLDGHIWDNYVYGIKGNNLIILIISDLKLFGEVQIMFHILQILTVILVAVAMALAQAHALELPGKMRLDKETYFAMQPIYYPGFTIAGVCEPVSILLAIALLFLTPSGSADFWLTIVALLGLIGMQAVYWLFTHPVNKFWIEGENLDRFSSSFFSFGVDKIENENHSPDWTELRDRWEYSHVARAGFGFLSLFALVIAIS